MAARRPYMQAMDNIDFGRLIYLLILGVAIVGYLIADNRASLGRMVRQALAWGLIFVGVLAGYGLWNDVVRDVLPRQSVARDGAIVVPRSPDGHFYLTLRLNDVPVRFVVDTGATNVVLSQADARRVGLEPDRLIYAGRANTANGEVATASARINTVELENITDRNMRVQVNGGEMNGSLLGMDYLRRFSKIEIEPDRLLLIR